MSVDEQAFTIIDVQKAMQDLSQVENKKQIIDSGLIETQKTTITTWRMAIGVAQASWRIMEGVAKLSGVTISQLTRASVIGALNVAQSLYAISSAYAVAGTVSPPLLISAAITAIAAGMSIYSAYQAQQAGESAAREIAGIRQTLGGIDSLIGVFYY